MESSKVHVLKGKKIVSYKLIEEKIAPAEVVAPDVMTEKVARPSNLRGTTYKISPTDGESSSLYITINDIVLNPGTEHEEIRPFEIFINSKNVEHVQWVSALTRVMSAVFRKGGDCAFLVDELEEVFDPRGGYWIGSKLMGSIVAHIGSILKEHFSSLGMVENGPLRSVPNLPPAGTVHTQSSPTSASDFPEHATLCKKCKHKAVVMMDNCPTCLNCSDSKCG